METGGQPTEPRDYEPAQQPTSKSPQPLAPGDPGYDPRYDPRNYVGGWTPKRRKYQPTPGWQAGSTGQPSGAANPAADPKVQQRNGFIVLGIVALVVSCIAVSCHSQSSSGGISDDPVTACDGVNPIYYQLAPGTLSAQVAGQDTTHIVAEQTFTLVYTGDDGDTFQPGQVSVVAVPYFDGKIQPQDADSGTFPLTQQEITGTVVSVPVVFPFTDPTASNPYSKPDPYCIGFTITYTQPDGNLATVEALVGLQVDASS